jgi:hypothetical protein
MSNVLFAGLNRAGKAIVTALPDETTRLYEPEWLLADPKEPRAAQMAGVLMDRYPTLRPQPLQMKAKDALAYLNEQDTLVLGLDTPADIIETLEARLPSQRALCQLVGRGPGDTAGTRLAIQGTMCPQDHDTERRALLFLHTLAGMSQAASSRQLTGPDPLSAAVLTPLRQAAARQTARHLGEKEREPQDLSGGPLSVLFGPTVYPLIPVRGGPQDSHSHWEDRALDAAGEVPAKHFMSRGTYGGSAYVAVVIRESRAIHFMKVAQNRTGKRSIAGLTSFVSPRVQQQSQSAVFTD